MANATIQRPDVFPNGTSVAAYPWYGTDSGTGAPIQGTTAEDTKTVASDQAAFTTLTAGKSYVLVGDNGATLRFRSTETSTGLAQAAAVPTWQTRRLAAGLSSR